jgi:ATP-dependent helicase HrpB
MLPIEAVLPDIRAALRDGTRAVLVAPPGAGKTTMVAPALLGEDWCRGEILLLAPRRLAARAAAEHMAALAAEPVGKTYGYATRMDAKRSAATRVTVLTEGIFRNRILADPELSGVSAVLFDEVHERSLDSDFGLALALEAQATFRPDLRLVAMSATLDGARFAALMDGEGGNSVSVIESEGRAHPLMLRHLGRNADRIEDDMASAIRQALREEQGDLLAFLPGVAEISRTAERLAGLNADILPLHGTLRPDEQRGALGRSDRRKVILATSIAETSLTIDGVRIVVDSGLARRPRYDRGAGVTRLVTERASQASVTQRAGRAARQSPGVAYRLWEEAATAGLPRFDPPEILEADLSSLVLDCAIWGEPDPRALRWLDPPPAAAVDEARKRLALLDAIDAQGRPTAHGEAIARLPLPPRLAHMLVLADDKLLAAKIAMLLSERGLGGSDTDLEDRLRRWSNDRGQRAEAARRTAARWAQLVPGESNKLATVAELLALAFPDRVARRRGASGEDWLSTGGRGFRLETTASLAKAEWLAVAEVAGQAAGARILSAAILDPRAIDTLFADRIETRRTLTFDPATGSVSATRERRLGAIVLKRGADEAITQAEREAAMVAGVRQHGIGVLRFSSGAQTLRARAAYAGLDLTDDTLMARLDDWLPAAVAGQRHLPETKTDALLNLLDWPERQQLDTRAPRHFTSPAETTHQIDYAAEGGPRVELRVQALFGLDRHPMIGSTPLVLSLTSPAGRPIQTTRDLPAFWRGSWADVAKDMRGRYPRHNWPDDPTAAPASLKTKKRQGL